MEKDKINRLMAETMSRNFQMGSIHDYKGNELPKSLQRSLDYHKSWSSLIPVVSVLNKKFVYMHSVLGRPQNFPKSFPTNYGKVISIAILNNDIKQAFEHAGVLLEWFKNNPEETWK